MSIKGGIAKGNKENKQGELIKPIFIATYTSLDEKRNKHKWESGEYMLDQFSKLHCNVLEFN